MHIVKHTKKQNASKFETKTRKKEQIRLDMKVQTYIVTGYFITHTMNKQTTEVEQMLTETDKRILENWIMLASLGKTAQEIEALSSDEGFKKSEACLEKIKKNPTQATEYIRSLYF